MLNFINFHRSKVTTILFFLENDGYTFTLTKSIISPIQGRTNVSVVAALMTTLRQHGSF